MGSKQMTAAAGECPVINATPADSDLAKSNGRAAQHEADEVITYEPVPLSLHITVRASVKNIGKLPIAPFPLDE